MKKIFIILVYLVSTLIPVAQEKQSYYGYRLTPVKDIKVLIVFVSFEDCRIESVKHTGADTNEYIYYFINFYQDNDRHCADYYFVKRNTNTENLLPKNINDSLGIGGYEVDVSFSGCMKEIADQTNAFHDSFHKYRFYSISNIEGFKINSIIKNERTVK